MTETDSVLKAHNHLEIVVITHADSAVQENQDRIWFYLVNELEVDRSKTAPVAMVHGIRNA
jgi:hypothetical protein